LRRCRAAVMTAFGSPLEIVDFPLPEVIQPGAALVKVEMAGVCGTDVHLWKGQLPIQLPVILGHETVGRLVSVGEGLQLDWDGQPLAVGDRVTRNSSRSCGVCHYCRRRLPTRCLERKAYGISYPADAPPYLSGGFAEYIHLQPGTAIFRLPDGLETEQVIGSGCALVTAIHGIERVGIDWGDSVLIQGAGPVGIAALAVALSAGASRVGVIGGPARRLEMARRFGAEMTIDLDAIPDPAVRRDVATEWSGGYGADVVIECTGSPPAVAEGWPLCRDGGRYLVLGHYADAGETPLNPHLITRKELTVYGSWGSEPRHTSAGLKFLRRAAAQFPFQEMVSDRFDLSRANEALRAMESWSARKSVVIPE